MKFIEIPGEHKVRKAAFICNKLNYQLSYHRLKYWNKQFREGRKVENESIITLENLPQFEIDISTEIWIYSETEIIRRATVTSEKKILLYNETEDLSTVRLIYDNSCITNGKGYKSVKQTVFQAIADLENVDFRFCEQRYYDQWGSLDVPISSDNFLQVFQTGLNVDYKTKEDEIFRIQRSLEERALFVVILRDTEVIRGNEFLLVSDGPLALSCRKSAVCCYSGRNDNLVRHERTCTDETTITFVRTKCHGLTPKYISLIKNKYFNKISDTYNRKFLLVNVFSTVDEEKNLNITDVAFYSNISNIRGTIPPNNWLTELSVYILSEQKKYINFRINNFNTQSKKFWDYLQKNKTKKHLMESKKSDFAINANFFLDFMKLKVFCNDLKVLQPHIANLKSLLNTKEFLITGKSSGFLSIETDTIKFLNLRTFSNRNLDIEALSKCWLGKDGITGLPQTLILSKDDTLIEFPHVMDESEEELRQRNILMLNGCSFEDFISTRNGTVCEQLFDVITVMAEYFERVVNCDMFTHCSLSSLSYQAMMQLYDKSQLPFYTLSDKNKFYAEEIQKFCWGGLNFVLSNHVTTGNDDKFPYQAKYTSCGDKINEIVSFDINSQYLNCFTKDLPTGVPIIISRNGNTFKPTIETNSDNVSLESLRWLEYEMENNSVITGHKIQHGLNGGEVIVSGIKVDGFLEIGTQKYCWLFDGCYWHSCFDCYPTESLDGPKQLEQMEKQHDDDITREKLQQVATLFHMKECVWEKLKKSTRFSPRPIFLREPIQEKDLLSPHFFGFIKCRLKMDKKRFEHFKWLGMTPLFDKVDSVLVPTESSTILVYSPLLQWYLSLGITVTFVEYAIEYRASKPLCLFARKLETLRQAAYNKNDVTMTELIKIIGNTSVGRLGMRVDKFNKVEIKPEGRHNTSRLLDVSGDVITRKYRNRQVKSVL